MRKIIKKKSIKLNKIISTQDKTQEGKMTITLLENPVTDNNNNNDEKNNIKNNIDSNEMNLERTESEENLFIAIQETDNLRNILKEKKEELAYNKLNNDNELLLINQNLKDKSIKLENVSNDTKILFNKLNLLNKQINEGYNKVNIIHAFNKINKNNINDLKKNEKKKVNQGKKIIYLNNKIIDKFKIQKEKLEKIIEENMELKLKNLKLKLEELKKVESDIKNEIGELNLIKKNHEKKCIQINEDLNKVLERTKNEYNDEYKSKNNRINNIKSIEPSNVSSIYNLPKIVNGGNNLTTIPTSEIKAVFENVTNTNNSKISSRNYKSMSSIFGEDYFMQKDLMEIKNKLKNNMRLKLNQKLKTYISNYSEQKKKKNSLSKNISSEKNLLFSKLEKEMLSQVIPKECLKIYQDKFKSIEEGRYKIKKKLNTNESKKKINEEKAQLLFITVKRDNNIIKKNIELNYKISAIKRKMNIVLKDIKTIENKINPIREKYKIKKEENERLKTHWTLFNNDIKNKKLGVKKDVTISKEDLDDLNRWGNSVSIPINKKINNEETCDNNISSRKNVLIKEGDAE